MRRSICAALLVLAAPVSAQKPAVKPADYGKFETPGAAVLSPNGQWFAYGVTRVNEENELRLRPVARDTVIVAQYGTGAQFTGDSRWVAYAIGVSSAERERLTRERKTVRNKLAIRNLATGDTAVIDDIASFRFSPDGRFIAMRGYPAEGKRGADVIVRRLATGVNTNFGNVAEYAWSDIGGVLAVTIDSENGVGNGVQLYDANTGTLRVLDSSQSRYRGLVWRERSQDLAVMRAAPDSLFADTAHVLLAWKQAPSLNETRSVLELQATPPNAALPMEVRVSETRPLQWSKDGQAIYFGLRPRTRAVRRAGRDSASATPSDVQIWHGRDVRIIPQQKAQEQQDLERTLMGVWHQTDGRVLQVGTDMQETVRVLEGGRWATETNRSNHAFGTMYGRPSQDVWLIDLKTGERREVLRNVRQFFGGSATGRYLLFYDTAGYQSYDIESGTTRNLSANVAARFANQEYDFPGDMRPPYGVAGWTKGDGAVLVYDRRDIWSLAADGSGGRRLTNSGAANVVHRYAPVIPMRAGIDLARGIYVTLFNEDTKGTGWARVRAGREAERLLLEDARLARLVRADSSDTFVFTRERYDDAPDWFVAGADLRNATQLSRLNPFQGDYAWGSASLVKYTVPGGRELHGVLLYPANYDASRSYPMIVYTYEMLSQTVHNYVVPSERSYYNFNVWTANGYFVLMPDIVYRGREPGPSALEAVTAAVAAAQRQVRIDRIGLVGHSWGGYQATYLPTRTNLFAASVAGAPITNFLSFAGAIHWTPGIPEFSHWETGQARMDVPFWEDLDAYLESSPAHKVHELRTPMLMMFGDADGTVDWHQGVEFYNFARRAGRDDFVMLVYPGEDHGLRKKENQIDYHRRINEWFGHWLKGEPAPKWITEGMTWLQRKDLLNVRR